MYVHAYVTPKFYTMTKQYNNYYTNPLPLMNGKPFNLMNAVVTQHDLIISDRKWQLAMNACDLIAINQQNSH